MTFFLIYRRVVDDSKFNDNDCYEATQKREWERIRRKIDKRDEEQLEKGHKEQLFYFVSLFNFPKNALYTFFFSGDSLYASHLCERYKYSQKDLAPDTIFFFIFLTFAFPFYRLEKNIFLLFISEKKKLNFQNFDKLLF